jgi:adenylylsulfate kinase
MASAGVFREYLSRSVAKALSYRVIVVVADFAAVYLFTGRVEIALAFVVVSNIYTSILYFFHERFWDRVAWGRGVD